MKYNFIFVCLVLILVISLYPLDALDISLMGADKEWTPPAGEEYMALNFGLFATADVQQKLMEDQPKLSSLFDEERFSMDYRTQLLRIFIDGSLVNDGKYSAQEPYMGGRYIYLNDAYVTIESDLFNIKVGRGPHHDVVDSPYSLFISSADIPVLYGEINYTGDFFFYKTRWVNMSYNSAQIYYGTENMAPPGVSWPDGTTANIDSTYWLDKGMNFKVYGVNVGDWRFGIEDVVVYLNRPFDAEYFFNPLPQYFVQLFTTELGVPWAQAGNTGSLMGYFADVNRGDWGGNVQFLIDDLNLDFLPFIPERSFKDKVAWSFGAWKVFDFGTMGFHQAGATKYTFASTRTIESSSDWGSEGYVDVPYSILPYDYAYYPATEYKMKNGDQMPVYYEDMYAGYKYGENNLAFLLDYEATMFSGRPEEFKLYTYLEYVMNGSKSPSNPWHEYDSPRNPNIESFNWVMFAGEPIEHILRIKANVRKKIGNFTLMAEILAGFVFNGIKLVSVAPDYEDYATVTWEEPKIYMPQNGNNFPVFQCTLGFNYSLQVH